MMISRAYEKIKAKKAEKKVREEELERGASNGRQPAQAPSTDSPSASELVGKPVLDDGDESFLRQLTNGDCRRDSTEEGPAPPLPPRVKTPVIEWDSDDDDDDEGNRDGEACRESNREARPSPVKKEGVEAISPDRKKKKQKKPKASRFSIFVRKQDTKKGLEPEHLAPVSKPEAERERDDLTQVLDDLNLSARNNRAFSLSADSAELVSKFTLVLKDLVNGVPTAVGDLQALLEDRDGTLARTYEKLPASLKKLVTQLPSKLTSTLAPELLAVAAEAQALSREDSAASGSLKGAAKRLLTPRNLQELVTRPGAIVSMLKAIMNALKVRWPAFMGTNVIWSVAIFLLLFVLWYCHKRGRETRLEREQAADDRAPVEAPPNNDGGGAESAQPATSS